MYKSSDEKKNGKWKIKSFLQDFQIDLTKTAYGLGWIVKFLVLCFLSF